jgi:hypothetical protein
LLGFSPSLWGWLAIKKMEAYQAFAEYVIIGTFLSVLITLVIFKISLSLLPER